MLKCGRCEAATYCSKECQKQHWKTEHKHGCGTFKKQPLTRLEVARLLDAVTP